MDTRKGILRINPRVQQTFGFIQSEHDVHILDRAARLSFDQVVNQADHNQLSGSVPYASSLNKLPLVLCNLEKNNFRGYCVSFGVQSADPFAKRARAAVDPRHVELPKGPKARLEAKT